MILSFKKKFKPLILSGQKIHTLREDKQGRWKAGNKIHMATGVRTKDYDCFMEDDCEAVQKIEIKYLKVFRIYHIFVKIDGSIFYTDIGPSKNETSAMEQLAKNDGFDSIEDFFKWFNTDFSGVIIHWTDFLY